MNLALPDSAPCAAATIAVLGLLAPSHRTQVEGHNANRPGRLSWWLRKGLAPLQSAGIAPGPVASPSPASRFCQRSGSPCRAQQSWEPPLPLGQVAQPALDKAAQLQRALLPSLLGQHHPGLTGQEFLRRGLEDYRRGASALSFRRSGGGSYFAGPSSAMPAPSGGMTWRSTWRMILLERTGRPRRYQRIWPRAWRASAPRSQPALIP